MDPYEQQLLTVFNSYDDTNLGSLDSTGLAQLCATLQLDDHSPELIRCLLPDPKSSRATFPEFKDALLQLLGNMQLKPNNTEIESPEREVSPKFVYGSKKYGRRSRPRLEPTNEQAPPQNEDEKRSNASVQRSNSQSEVSNSKKRKTNYKLKRCTSLPGQKIENHAFASLQTEFICTEEMLREAWKKLGVGEDGFLNQTELILVCDAIGLHKLANGVIRQLSDKLVDFDHRISFQELLEALQEDETWSEVLETSTNSQDITLTMINQEMFPDSATFRFVTLGPTGNGMISADTLIEMWEIVGITAPKELIHELGFNEHEISISELAKSLENEIKSLNHHMETSDPHLVLLQANLALYQSEIRCLKSLFEQMQAEREKLKCDVYEANNRATLLAQEVDDNHLKMERNTLNQVKLLEQRQADILKELTQSHFNEKEQFTCLNQSLEEKIANLEHESAKLKNDLIVAQKYSNSVEKENQSLLRKIGDLQQMKTLLTNQIETFENEKQKYVESEHEQIEPLLAKLNNLQLENAQLRDKNDEMVAEIENLTCQVATMRNKVVNTPMYSTLDHSMDDFVDGESISVVCEGVGLGAKRRSDYSPSKDADGIFGVVAGAVSPRMGKVRKFHKTRPDHLDIVPFTSNESGFDAEIDSFDTSSVSTTNDQTDEVIRLQAKIAFLHQILVQHSIPIPNDGNFLESVDNVGELKSRVHHLESIIAELAQVNKMIAENGLNPKLGERIEAALAGRPQQPIATMQAYEKENETLKAKCDELEKCVDLLRNEYEKCEDYWQSKLDEERQIFELEQHQSSEKLTDLINKMAEYEEQFANNQEEDARLPTIDETSQLEQQFTDLEQEFEDYKQFAEGEIFKRDEQITELRQKLDEWAPKMDESGRIAAKMATMSLNVIETTNLFAADAQPQLEFAWSRSADSSLSWQNLPSTSTSETATDRTPCRPKRTRKHERNSCMYKKNATEAKKPENTGMEEQVIALPISTIHGLNGRLHHLEQRCRQLQMVLKQQHFHTEQTLQQVRQHARSEKVELQCVLRNNQEKFEQQARICNDQLERLARSDMLAKELYVENSYLIAKVQRLEQQCHILAQYNANSSSV